RGTSWWNSGSVIDTRWKRPGSHQRGAGRLTTTRTVWTSSARDGHLSTRLSFWAAEVTRQASCRPREQADAREPAHLQECDGRPGPTSSRLSARRPPRARLAVRRTAGGDLRRL